MSTIICKVFVTKTDKRFTRNLISPKASYETNDHSQASITIPVGGDSVEREFSKLCVAYFPSPTVIQLVIGDITTITTVEGPLVLPLAGKLTVSHPGGGQTAPVEYEIFTS